MYIYIYIYLSVSLSISLSLYMKNNIYIYIYTYRFRAGPPTCGPRPCSGGARRALRCASGALRSGLLYAIMCCMQYYTIIQCNIV